MKEIQLVKLFRFDVRNSYEEAEKELNEELLKLQTGGNELLEVKPLDATIGSVVVIARYTTSVAGEIPSEGE